MTDAIKVAVRVRPLSKHEVENGHSFAWNVQSNFICPLDARDSRYTLDHVFGPNWTTRRIYEATTQPLLHKVISGFNSTVFAYGQTSSGKTYTMRGTREDEGLIPLAVNEIFDLIESCQDREFLLRVSYMELYNEEVHDLLAPKQMKLPIHESRENGVYVCGLREDIVTGPDQVLQLLEQGECNRHVGSTKMNDTSSRSHTVFRMKAALEADMNDAGAVLVSTLTLVDLAGSERVAKTGAEGIRMKEGTAINKSLLTLGNVINKLSEGAQAQGAHIPYRDSKLTRILQPSLGGNAKTSVICAITPALCHAEETHSTLRFACRAKRVVNNAVVNEVLSDAAVLKRQAHEIEELKNRLSASGMTAEVEEQISHLRAQHLRSEQEKDLYRIKLEEEKLEREKAQKQVEVARKMMFEGGGGRDDVPKKNNRRETWCPGGKAGWQAPAGAAEAFQAAGTDPGEGLNNTGTRKRSYNGDVHLTGGLDGSNLQQHIHHVCHHSSNAIAESEEEDEGEALETVGEGPTPQRRRAGKSMGSTSSDASELHDGGVLLNELERIADGLDGQDRATLEAAISQLGGASTQMAAMQRELDDVAKLATTKDDELRYAESEMEAAVEERDRLAPQVEEAKWQARQLEKRIEEVQAAHHATRKDCDALAEQLKMLQESSAAELEEVHAMLSGMEAERAGLKEQVKALNTSLADAKEALECEAEQRKIMEARVHASSGELAEAEAQLSKRSAELDAMRKAHGVVQECMEAAETRGRDLYEANKRLEAHVHDLESRKRAPLYQKKQEEELRTANEKATEADVRATEAELNAKELKASAETLQNQLADLQCAAEKAARIAAEAASEKAAKHSFEIQRLANERARIQDAHMEELEQLNFLLESTKEALAEQQATAGAQAKQVEELQGRLSDVQRQMSERDALQAELQACASAASEKIVHLEEEAEATQAAHDQLVEDLRKELQTAQEGASAMEISLREQLQIEATAAADQLKSSQEQAGEEVRAAQAQAEEAKAAAAASTADAFKQLSDMRVHVSTMEARLSEAAGALKAKDELREERMRHKQEASALKSDIQKLQLESKNGGKSKDLAAKELEALKKKLGDLENKLRVAVQDKTSAVQEKSKLESQVKQLVSQKQLLDKNQGKQENIELKKRESIMVNFNKNREVLNSTEEKLKAATVELQKTNMDLVAKRSECQGLEGQVAELESKISQLQIDNTRLASGLSATQEAKDSLQAEHASVQEHLAARSNEFEALKAAHEATSTALSSLHEEHTAASAAKEHLEAEAEQLRAALQELTTSSNKMAEQNSSLQSEYAELSRQHDCAQEELAAARAAASAAEDARIAAESRLPELQELQQQLSSAHEQVADLQYAAHEQQAAAAQQEKAAAEKLKAAEKAAQELLSNLQQVEASQVATQSRRDELQQHLDQAVELYTVVQGHADTMSADKARLEEQLAEQAQAHEGSCARVAALEGELEGLKNELEVLRGQLSQAEAHAANTSESLAKVQADLEAACTSREAAQQEAAAAKAGPGAAAAGSEEAAGLKGQLMQVMQEFTDLEFGWNEERAALEVQVQQLHEQLAATQAAAAAGGNAMQGTAQQEGTVDNNGSKATGLANGAEATPTIQEQQVQGMEGADRGRVDHLEREVQALQGERNTLLQACNQLQQQQLDSQTDGHATRTASPGPAPSAFGSPLAAAGPTAVAAGRPADVQVALVASNAAREALEQHNQQLESHRNQLLGVIDDLSKQLASAKASASAAPDGLDHGQPQPQPIVANEVEDVVGGADGKAGIVPTSQQQQGGGVLEASVTALQQALTEAQAELASKYVQLQEACQAYNDLSSEVADKDLQLQQLQSAKPTEQGTEHESSQPQGTAQQQHQERVQLEHKLGEAEAALEALRARCAQLEGEVCISVAAAAGRAVTAAQYAGGGDVEMEEGCKAGPTDTADQADASAGNSGNGGGRMLEMQQQMHALVQDLASLQATKDALQKDADQRVQQLQQQLKEVQQQQHVTDAAPEDSGAEAAKVAEVEDMKAELQRLEAQVEQLKVALDNALAARATVESHLQLSLDDASSAQVALKAQQQQLPQTETQDGQPESREDQQQVQLSSQIAQLQIALDNAIATRASVEARLNAEAEDAKAMAAGLGQELDTVRARVEQLETDLLDSETLAGQLRAALDAKTYAVQQATAQLQEAQAGVAELSEQLGVVQGQLGDALQQAGTATLEVERLKEALRVETSRREDACAMGKALQSSLDDLQLHLTSLDARAAEAEAGRAALAERLESVHHPHGPTPAQQEMLARMAQRLEALEAGHRRAVERLHEERDEARAAVESLQAQVEAERQQGAVALEEVDLCAKAKEAELNARMLSLESQIHWLGEQNTQLQAELAKVCNNGIDKENSSSGVSVLATEQIAELGRKCAALETDLRRTKRAELKLQALLFRMRSDIEKAGGSAASFDDLREVRSLEYDVDMLTQKLKRTERLLQQQRQGYGGNAGDAAGTPLKDSGGSNRQGMDKVAVPFADKENMQQAGLPTRQPSNANVRW